MKIALVTGANRGIGLEFVKQLAQQDWRVFACCRNPAEADVLSQLAQASGGKVTTHTLTVDNPDHLSQLAQTLKDQTIDLLINNAGVYSGRNDERFGTCATDEWLKVFEINTIAPLKIAEAFIENVARSELKTIASVTSKMGSMGDNTSGGAYMYRSSKAALNMVMKSMAHDLEPRGIKVALVHPGWVKTDMGGPNAWISPQQSVAGMLNVILQLGWQDSGRFLAYDGAEIEW